MTKAKLCHKDKIKDQDGLEQCFDGDKVGVLLDLNGNTGTVTFFKNGLRMGPPVSGLSGRFSPVVDLSGDGAAAKIVPAIMPKQAREVVNQRRLVASRKDRL